MDEIDAHPHARAVIGPVARGDVEPSHAYLFHGPAGSGRSEAAAALASELLGRESLRDDTPTRVHARTHPDLTWVTPEGANGEILVDDVRDRIVAAMPMTPFEARCRVFVIEGAGRMNDSASNALLRTLEEPPPHARIILIAGSPAEVLPTIASRCQAVRFDTPSVDALRARLEAVGIEAGLAGECARLADGDGTRARLLATTEGQALRAAGERLARGAVSAEWATARPWMEITAAASERGKAAEAEVLESATARLEVAAKSERPRVEKDAAERARRAKRRAESEATDLALHVAQGWLRDLHCAAIGAPELIRNGGDGDAIASAATTVDAAAVRRAIDEIGRTRRHLRLNVSRDLAIEALSHRMTESLR